VNVVNPAWSTGATRICTTGTASSGTDGDPLAPAFRRYFTSGLPAALYAVSEPGSPFNTFDSGVRRPGFEMALV
jgi:hypothetical protein